MYNYIMFKDLPKELFLDVEDELFNWQKFYEKLIKLSVIQESWMKLCSDGGKGQVTFTRIHDFAFIFYGIPMRPDLTLL